MLRTAGFTYWQVFLATAALYTVGILRYRTIIRVVERSESEATCEAPLPGPGEIPR